MLDEEMDDIIKRASDQHYPTYDDQAWGKMESLLDKHLPQKKDNRRYLLLLLLFLLTGAGLYFALHSAKDKNEIAQTQAAGSVKTIEVQTNNTPPITASNQRVDKEEKTNIVNNSTGASITNNIVIKSASRSGFIANIHAATPNDNSLTGKSIQQKRKTKSRYKTKVSTGAADGIVDNQNNNNTDKEETIFAESTLATPVQQPNDVTENTIAKSTDSSLKKIVTADTANNKEPIASNTKKKEEKTNKFKSSFAITASVGPGLSYIDLNDAGKTTITYGAGVRYAFNKHFAVRTGFYVSKKIYSASPSDYHPPKQFWTYYPDLKQINANCQVYEIPLTLSYNFGLSKKHEWFGAAGLLSYLMKNETYQYNSQDAQGGQSTYTAVINNQNKNLFSVLSLSGGYQYNFTKRFSLMAEPFIELPLNGIGFGNIKLNSGGLLFTAVFKPFK
ncbi:porin family protein [Ferruginibacter albus]|uniref:outer membrane beta-barrel protein n=1 Tax=Ferruginibacter albus TaxID=2875540 RepID=UPI001CC47B9E|nr:outer membrane beta-barrel protein [Ferruginibacter albus]UAY52059.1 porin family protein [Ferruginibacter albus]